MGRSEARHNIAGALLAATRYRLATGALPQALETLVPDYLPTLPTDVFGRKKKKNADSTPGSAAPADPDGPQTALKLKQLEGVWTVYSVGPSGNDDGGPPPEGTEPDLGNDDIGLTLKR